MVSVVNGWHPGYNGARWMNATVEQQPALVKFRNLLLELEKWEDDIKLALHHGYDTHTIDDIINLIMANRVHFFSWETSFTIMEIIDYPRFKVYHCFLAGGDLAGVVRSIGPMSDVARALGCQYLSMAGRSGWQKVLRDEGWKFVCTTMYLDLGEANGQNAPN